MLRAPKLINDEVSLQGGNLNCFDLQYTMHNSTERHPMQNALSVNVNTQCNINFAKTFDVADEPITEGIEFHIEAKSPNADKQQFQEIIRLAQERCPAMYSMMYQIKVYAMIK